MKQNFETLLLQFGEFGTIEEIREPLIYASGLPNAHPNELICFEDNRYGKVLSITDRYVEILKLFPESERIGQKVVRTGMFMQVPVGDFLQGKLVDPFCNFLVRDESLFIDFSNERLVDVPAPSILQRSRISQQIPTGVTVVDLLVPLGYGQRELIIGDRKTGKTSFLRQTVANQARRGVICIYCSIGKKMSDVKELQNFFIQHGVADKVSLIASFSSDPLGVIFQAPYTAMTLAEYFRDLGNSVLIVLDDLTTHAKVHREISLVGRRFPGRESYPGDIFSIHSQLLERAGNFTINDKEVSITCLPVAESIESDLTGYIQTNLMSMTDGHIFFDNDYFTKGIRPAINPFLSVTRVGHQTQTQIRKDIYREVTTLLALAEKSESYSHFSADLSLGMRVTLATGKKVMEFLQQSAEQNFDVNLQTIIFAMLWVDMWHGNNEKMKEDKIRIAKMFNEDLEFSQFVNATVNKTEKFNDLLALVKDSKPLAQFVGI